MVTSGLLAVRAVVKKTNYFKKNDHDSQPRSQGLKGKALGTRLHDSCLLGWGWGGGWGRGE